MARLIDKDFPKEVTYVIELSESELRVLMNLLQGVEPNGDDPNQTADSLYDDMCRMGFHRFADYYELVDAEGNHLPSIHLQRS